ncbi:amino acid ABC transporter permease [Roseococcus suduntuyensis]|uniref:Putative glutamine transport system permease protein GlnP n=1 Tax=Roseococcus suduntuyensis TaxID=455361 RepID=A0A840ABC5_9PROT|nr:amino acid ABC transporter permease [Roseococcus suduntuyensis]MBB3898192.1 polar amino acid transport system permease protein [Roseococcus suduntuyensis]
MIFDWAVVQYAAPLLAHGVVMTLQVSSVAAVLGLVIGLAAGLGSLSNSLLLRGIIRFYVEFIRGTPLLIQIFLVFFALPVVGVRLPEFWAGVVALALNAGAYIAEVVRGTVGSIEKGQSEAALSIGMTRRGALLWVLLPQAWRPMLPALTNDLITLTKNSSLLSVISVYELTRAGQAIIATHFAPFEIFLLLALYYWALISALAWVSRRIEAALPSW